MGKTKQKASWMQSRIWSLPLLFTLLFVFALPVTANVMDGAKRVTLVNPDISVREALKSVEKQTGITIMFQSDIINDEIRLKLNLKNVSLREALEEICMPAGLQFEVKEDYILIVKAKERPKGASRKKITGTVIDEKGEPLMGVTIFIENDRSRGTITDANGHYELEAAPSDLMVFSYIGMTKQSITPRNDTVVNVAMQEDAKMLSDVVVTGFQTISKERATGAFDIIKQATLDKPSTTIADRLVGRIAGVQATTTADGDISFTIRGQGTLQSDKAPLIVVDGFPISTGFSSINPNDVESISILKDAAAASIWGARASNGVIVVTTKKGTKGKGLKVSVDAQVRIGSKTDIDYLRNILSSEETIEYQKKTFGTYQRPAKFPSSNPTSATLTDVFENAYTQAGVLYNKYKNLGEISESEYNAGLAALAQLDNKKQIEDELLRRPVYQQYNITLSGGTERMDNYVSLLYGYDISRYQKNNSQNFQFDYRGNMKLLKWLDMNISATARYKAADQSGASAGEFTALAPYDMIRNTDGSQADMSYLRQYADGVNTVLNKFNFPYSDWSYNIAREVNGRDVTDKILNGRFQVGFKATILEGLTFDTKFQYEYVQQDTRNLYSEDTYNVRNTINMYSTLDWKNNTAKPNIEKGNILRENKFTTDAYNWRNQINFNRTFAERHAINFVGGIEISQNKAKRRTFAPIYAYDDEYLTSYPIQNTKVEDIFGNKNAVIDTRSSFSYALQRYFSAFANLAYTFDDKYSISGSYRTDASNFISDDPKYRYSPFWSVGFSWNMTNENFMKSIHWLDYLRPRITYGRNGNANTTTSMYPLIEMMGIGRNSEVPYARFTAYGNPNMSWEHTNTVNIGFDWSMFHGKFYGKFDFYNKKGTDIMADVSVPIASGQFIITDQIAITGAKITANAAEITNRGIELELGGSLPIGKDFHWNGNVTLAYNKNEVDKFYVNYIDKSDMLRPTAVEGYNIFGLWAYRYAGLTEVNSTSGTGKSNVPSIYIDKEGNTSPINSIPPEVDGRDALEYMGTTIAPWTIGMSHAFSYKEWELSFTMTGKFGHKFRQTTFNYADPLTSIPNRQYSQLSDEGVIPMPTDKTIALSAYASFAPYMDYNIKSANNVRMQELSLSYSVPNRILNKWGISRLTCYLQGNNLFTIKATDEDPEYSYGSFRLQPTYTIGVKFAY